MILELLFFWKCLSGRPTVYLSVGCVEQVKHVDACSSRRFLTGRNQVSVSSKGLFIVFEGIDVSGKTTQASLLREWFLGQGETAILTQEPSEKGLYGRHLRLTLQGMLRLIASGDELAEEVVRAKLFALDRFVHLKNEIEPSLEQGVHVICDRYYLSSLVYQSVSLRQLGYALMDPLERVKQLNADALYAETQPDLIVLIDISTAVWAQRMRERAGSKEIYEQEALRQDFREAYQRAMQLFDVDERLRGKGVQVRIVRDEEGSLSPEHVHRQVVDWVRDVRSYTRSA